MGLEGLCELTSMIGRWSFWLVLTLYKVSSSRSLAMTSSQDSTSSTMVIVEVATSLCASSLRPQTWLMSRFYAWEMGSDSCWEEQRLAANGDESHVVGDLVGVSDWLWGMGTPRLGNSSEVEKLFEGTVRDKGRQSACSWVGPRQPTHSHSQAPARLLTSWKFCLAPSFMGTHPGGDHAWLCGQFTLHGSTTDAEDGLHFDRYSQSPCKALFRRYNDYNTHITDV